MQTSRGLEGVPHSGGRGLVRLAVLCLCFRFAAGTPAQQPVTAGIGDNSKVTFTSFDPPGYRLTFARPINTVGVLAGSYQDASLVDHNFVRAADGAIITFDTPGFVFTRVNSINTAGAVCGGN
jgi:hypothetical protein